MSVGAINSLLSGMPVSPVNRWSTQAEMPVEPAKITARAYANYETISLAERREYPRAQKSLLSEEAQEELRVYIKLELLRLFSFQKV